MIRIVRFIAAATLVIRAQVPPEQRQPERKPTAPIEAIGGILEAFKSHPIVALGNVEGGNEQSHQFRLALIRDPRFAAVANDIVVEFGNARFQDLIDRFVGGEEVPYESLRRVWRDTTQVEYEWDLPIYEEFFRAVRAVNARLPRARQLRVLLGDPPIDWSDIHNFQEFRSAMGDRDGHAAEVLRREVLAKGRRALIVYGGQHLMRRNTVPGAADTWARGVIARLEKDGLAKAFTILPETRRDLRSVDAQAGAWPIPSLVMLAGTALGGTVPDPDPRRRPVRAEEQFDAILYLGPPSSMTKSRLTPTQCSDRAYIELRTQRLNLIPPPPGAGPGASLAEQLRDSCAHPEGYKEIPDPEPAITEGIRKILRQAAQGKVSPDDIAPESRDRLVSFLERDGPRFLGPAGELESFKLVEDRNAAGKRMKRYRSVFASGLRLIWTVGLSPAGAIVSLDPRPE